MQTTIDAAETIVAILRAQADELHAAGIRHLSLFGSAARGEADCATISTGIGDVSFEHDPADCLADILENIGRIER